MDARQSETGALDRLSSLMTVKELAEKTPYSESYLRKLVSEKRIPFVKLSGKFVFFEKTAIDSWLAAKMETHEITA